MPEEVTADQQMLLDKVPADGTAIGNITLRAALAWADGRYWMVRDALIAKGLLVLGRGKGGSVRRGFQELHTADDVVETPGTSGPAGEDEGALYPPVARVLEEKWSKDLRLGEFFIQVTAKQGRRETGGTWTRPDIVAISVSTYQNVPGKFVDVTTFEVKTYDNCDVTSVYEALSHLRAATRAYVLIAVPEAREPELGKLLEEIAEEAGKHGVGLVVAREAANYDTWDFRVEAVTNQPDVAKLDEFIETQISEDNKRKLRKWIK